LIRCGVEDGTAQAGELRRRAEEQAGPCVGFRNTEGDTVVVWTTERREDGRLAASAFASALSVGSEGRYRLSIGTTEETGHESRSYESARRAQQLHLLLDRSEIADYEKMLPDPEYGAATASVDWEAYGRELLAQDAERLRETIENDFNRLRATEGAVPGQLRGLAVEIMVRLKMELDGMNRSGVSPDALFQSRIELALRASDLEALLKVVKETATLAIEELGREDRSPVVRQVLLHIERHYAEDMTLKLLGHKYNIHPVYLGKLFHQETGSTFTDYFNRFRILQAKKLLKETPLKVHEVARQVGYWESGYFHKQFKKIVGISPAEFKALL